ncbi:ComEC/Rec2 family competence protein [uncultured Jatrophihabitans sp.]|uniref:ComEC/Rec2 family competence protein n=1 Tax=uncultured Jatrophihabitans sp. TaxID=1610747 RepID=UPI0035CA5025
MSDDVERGQSAADEPLDLRLACGAGVAWLGVLCGACRGPSTCFTAALAATVLGVLCLLAARSRRGLTAPALALFCLALVLWPLAGRIAHARASPLAVLAGRHAAVDVELTVTADPRVLAAKGPAGSSRVAVETSASAVEYLGRRVVTDGSVLVLGDAGAWTDVLPGQRVRVPGSVQPSLDAGSLSVVLFTHGAPQLLGRPPWWQRLAGSVRSSLRRAASDLPEQERGLLPGLIDGDTANLDPVLAERFRLAGLTHLVAVSGTNCSILVGAVLLVLRRLRIRPWACAAVGGLVLALFVVVARPSPSVLRAALMAAVALAALATGRPRSALPVLAAVTIGLLLWDPTLAGSASFAMSVLATGALLVLAPRWAEALRRRHVPLGLAESTAVAAAAHLVTAPVVAALSGQVSLVAVPANVLAEPVVAVTTIVGFAAAVCAPVWLPAGSVLVWVAGWPCRWLVAVADFFGGLHGAVLPWPGGAAGGMLLLVVTVVIWFACVRAGPRRMVAAGMVTALMVLIPVRSVTSGWPASGWVFVACDIGQGDGLVLSAGPHQAVVVDAGPDPVPMDRCLHDLGVTDVPLLIFTHMHADHVGGIVGVGHGRRVGQILAGPLGDPESGLLLVRRFAAGRHLSLRTPAPGTAIDVGAVHLEVLGPAAAFHATRSDPNNSSLVLRATVAGVRILLPGDAEIEAQDALVRSGVDLRADVLKIPHHGSAYSDPAFLAAAHASVAVVSVGVDNDYGHPSPVLLAEVARLGIPLLRTDRDGDVAVVSDHGAVRTAVHGTASSRVGASRVGASGLNSLRASVVDARMEPCPPDPSVSMICPARCRPSSCSLVRRTCSSIGRSARSPPRRGPKTRRS